MKGIKNRYIALWSKEHWIFASSNYYIVQCVTQDLLALNLKLSIKKKKGLYKGANF